MSEEKSAELDDDKGRRRDDEWGCQRRTLALWTRKVRWRNTVWEVSEDKVTRGKGKDRG